MHRSRVHPIQVTPRAAADMPCLRWPVPCGTMFGSGMTIMVHSRAVRHGRDPRGNSSAMTARSTGREFRPAEPRRRRCCPVWPMRSRRGWSPTQGFPAAYVTGAGIANTCSASPTIGLVTADRARRPRRRRSARSSGHRCMVDADTGFGNRPEHGTHRQAAGTRGADAHPDRGPGVSEALRPFRRQGGHSGRRDGGRR